MRTSFTDKGNNMHSHNTTNQDQVNNSTIASNVVDLPKTKTIVRVIKNRDFLQVSHTPLYDKRLSLKAKGILCIMLSMSDEWEFRREHLLTLCSDGRDSLRTALKELQEFGYVTLNSERDEKGRIQKWIMLVCEDPKTLADQSATILNGKSVQARSGFSASGETPIESGPPAQLSRSGFSTCGESACNNTNPNNINNNNAVAEKLNGKIPKAGIPVEVMTQWVITYSEPYVQAKIDLMLTKGKITNPLGWLKKALENNYVADKSNNPVSASLEIWSPELQQERNKTVETLANPLDWRDIELQRMMEKLGA
jgi:hypothetical protein